MCCAGICCGADGDGSYQALVDGVQVAAGGEYGSSETTQFSLAEIQICSVFDLNIVVDEFPIEISWEVLRSDLTSVKQHSYNLAVVVCFD